MPQNIETQISGKLAAGMSSFVQSTLAKLNSYKGSCKATFNGGLPIEAKNNKSLRVLSVSVVKNII